jgi:hypothetical protein
MMFNGPVTSPVTVSNVLPNRKTTTKTCPTMLKPTLDRFQKDTLTIGLPASLIYYSTCITSSRPALCKRIRASRRIFLLRLYDGDGVWSFFRSSGVIRNLGSSAREILERLKGDIILSWGNGDIVKTLGFKLVLSMLFRLSIRGVRGHFEGGNVRFHVQEVVGLESVFLVAIHFVPTEAVRVSAR